MDRQKLIDRFEAEMALVARERPDAEKLMQYIRTSDFYTAPASTKYHLSCEGGLLQHSLNVLDALRGLLIWNPIEKCWEYQTARKVATTFDGNSVTIVALLHDICKTNFYGVSTRNVKNEQTGKWEKKPYYTVEDKMPLGHGPKSAMIVKQYMSLTTAEMYAIWHHMGYSDTQDFNTLNAAIQKYPLIWALHTADVIAMSFMEDAAGNKPLFLEPSQATAGGFGEQLETGEPDLYPAQDEPGPAADEWQEAPPLQGA